MQLPDIFIREGLETGRVIPFLGAGASLATPPLHGLPSAGEVADQLARPTHYPKSQRQLATVAQLYEIVLGRGALHSTLHTAFTPADVGPMPVHTWLAAFDAKLLIVTTNYDDLLEQAFQAAGKPYDVVVHTTDPEAARCVLWWPHGAEKPREVLPKKLPIRLRETTVIYKMHGGIDRLDARRDQYVVTEDDYVDFLARMTSNTAVPAIFAEPFEHRHFLFLGYGLRDWNLRVVLHQIQKDLYRRPDLTSWAIDAYPSELEQRFWQRRGVEVFKMRIDQFLLKMREA
jgi:hypothetical protein